MSASAEVHAAEQAGTGFEGLLAGARVVPVITLDDASLAVPLAGALIAGGLHVLEVTLRTDAALEAIRLIAAEVPGAVVGAGTVTNPRQLQQACDAGARFIVSPGCTDALARAAAEARTVFVPGAVTASEVLRLLERGITLMKFFPAQASGGVDALRAFAGPFPQVRFCPTGGIDIGLAADYLALPNVVCVGGAWMVPPGLVGDGRWEEVRALALQASAATRPALAASETPAG
ncbi:MAG: bifunctional 4-hydroxy-2-oxoglutarate aldolase/2-dehydro-3-deoxy-phosphogluconate aldolase [Actinomycetota bacterium]|nr:bifunctional 4-hydroxy-2-oxoglutarate aldolase/2-dehydro-3-deoxy-phosphogluconate aldolase [Actinomycetota bacterium]